MNDVEKIRLEMQCTCSDELRAKLDEQLVRAYAALSNEVHKVDVGSFASASIYFLSDMGQRDVEFVSDQWGGINVVEKKYEECTHADDDCPDEPKCFVYRWNIVKKVYVECDRFEDGLAALVLWFKGQEAKT